MERVRKLTIPTKRTKLDAKDHNQRQYRFRFSLDDCPRSSQARRTIGSLSREAHMFQGKRRCVVSSAFLAIAVCITSGMVRAQGVPLYPDIVEQIAHLQIQNEHQREMLRFSTTHINIGDGPLQIRGGGQVAPCVIDGTAYAQCTYATQEVLDAAGNIVHSQPAGVAFFHPQQIIRCRRWKPTLLDRQFAARCARRLIANNAATRDQGKSAGSSSTSGSKKRSNSKRRHNSNPR